MSAKPPFSSLSADNDGGKQANYHGTTTLTQTMRGLWPDMLEKLERSGVLMNYGGIRLSEEFLQKSYEICRERDIPTIVDEIQSCIWSPELFLYREYQLEPDFVSVGKGFPGGQYPASKILTSAIMDNLNQFGALVTNGQEELASLAYLITMEFAQANREYTAGLGSYYEQELKALAERHSEVIDRIEGQRHLSAIFFYSTEKAVAFIERLNKAGIDISAHTYNPKCPPSALTRIPLAATYKIVDFMIQKNGRSP